METQTELNFSRIAQAIEYIQTHFKEHPDLETIAAQVHLSPHHFQKLFTDWAGTSPKQFLQYISLEHAKKLLKEDKHTLLDASLDTGFSSTSRLHDLFIKIEGMTPASYKNGGKDLHINYSFETSIFGAILIASTEKGICHLAFEADQAKALSDLSHRFPNAILTEHRAPNQESALRIFHNDWSDLNEIKLHLKGTDFQVKVWESLLKIPMGALSTYGEIAGELGHPKASRAVGTAIGSNPVAFLIPCHRVIRNSGMIGGYMWGPVRKTALIGWESAQRFEEQQ